MPFKNRFGFSKKLFFLSVKNINFEDPFSTIKNLLCNGKGTIDGNKEPLFFVSMCLLVYGGPKYVWTLKNYYMWLWTTKPVFFEIYA